MENGATLEGHRAVFPYIIIIIVVYNDLFIQDLYFCKDDKQIFIIIIIIILL